MMATVRLGPEILFVLEMKGQVPHCTRAHFCEHLRDVEINDKDASKPVA